MSYDGEKSSKGQPHGKGKYTFSEDEYYDGQWIHGEFHGYGVYQFATGNRYAGNFEKGKMTGHAEWSSKNGDTYVGEFLDGVRHGVGICNFARGDIYEGEWVQGERTGQGIMKYVTDVPGKFQVYEGEFDKGKMHGHGSYLFSNGNKYEGEWVENKMTGSGIWTSPQGDKYVGDYVDGERHGFGCYTFADGDSYEGEWVHGERTGQGVMKSVTETPGVFSVFEGEFVQGKRHGFGLYKYSNGNRYEGAWSENQMTGNGCWTSVAGDKYNGSFVDGERDGLGTYTFADGDVYEGEWVRGERTGRGMMHFAPAPGADEGAATSKYEGEFVNGNMHGYGIYYFANGNRYEGDFVDGSMTGTGMWTSHGGDKYLGVFKNGERHGLGTYSFVSGERYEGEWFEGERCGHGLLVRPDGAKYVGDFKDGRFEGKGAFYYANGDVFHGMYVDGKMCGEGKMEYADGSYYEGEYAGDERNGAGTYFSASDNKVHKGDWVLGVMTSGKTSAGIAPAPSVLSKLGKGAVLLTSRDIRESPVGVHFAGDQKFQQVAGSSKTLRASQVKLLLPPAFQSDDIHAIKEFVAREGKTFVDPDFVPLASSLFAPDDEKDDGGVQIVWNRPTQFMRGNYKVFDTIEPCDIKQGYLGDCWYLSALASLAEFPVLIEALFTEESKRVSAEGIYEMNFCISGQWKTVLLDDFFPCRGPRGGPMYAGCNGNELWAMLAEKGYAKLQGAYSRIEGGMPEEALMDLTGDPTTTYYFEKEEVKAMVADGVLWDKLVYADSVGYVLTASTHGKDTETKDGDNKDGKKDGSGLVQGHAYSLIAVQELSNGTKLLLLRNPWGTKEWTGDWGDKSPLWTPKLKKEVADTKHDFSNKSDGLFWMAMTDVLVHFDRISICACRTPGYHPKPWKETRTKTFFTYSPELNEVYLSCILKVKPVADTMAQVTVHQANKRTVGAPEYIDIGVTILKVIDNGPGKKESYEHVASTGCVVERETGVEVPMLYADSTYLVVAVTTGGVLRQQHHVKATASAAAATVAGAGSLPATPTKHPLPPPPSPAPSPAGVVATPSSSSSSSAGSIPLFDGEELSAVGEKVVDELFNRYDLLQEQGLNETSLDWVLQCIKPAWTQTERSTKIQKMLASFDTKAPEPGSASSGRLLTQYGFRAAMSCNHADSVNGHMRTNTGASSGVAHAAAKARQKALLSDLHALGYDDDLNLVGARSINIAIHSEEDISHCFVSSDPDGLIYEAAMELPVVHTGSCEGMEYSDWKMFTKSNGFSGSSYCAQNLSKDRALDISYTVTGINVTSATGALAGSLLIPPGECEILQHVMPTRGSHSWNAGISFSTKHAKWTEEHLHGNVCKQQARRLAAIKENPSLAVFSKVKVPSKTSSEFVTISRQKSSLQFLSQEY